MQAIYTCWRSETCGVCAEVYGGPRFHASTKGWSATSPCATTGVKIVATSRAEALRLYKRALRRPQTVGV